MTDRTPVYVALGDSISIDIYAGGPGRGGASLLYRNRDDDFPDWSGRDLSSIQPGTAFHLLATDGATSATVLGFQLPRLLSLGDVPTVVTLTAGGNDLLQAYGNTGAARRVIEGVVANVDQVLTELVSLAGSDLRVAVGTVYDPSDGTGDHAALGLPPWPDGVAMIGELNARLVELAGRHGAAVADIHGCFLGHGLTAGNAAQRDSRPRDRDLWYLGVIEPNAWGASAVRAAFWDAVTTG